MTTGSAGDRGLRSSPRFREALHLRSVRRAGAEARCRWGRWFRGFRFLRRARGLHEGFRGFGGIEDLFGGRQQGRGSRSAPQGEAIKVRVRVSLPEVATGVAKTLKVAILDICERCSGSGSADGAAPTPCATCGGSGEVRQAQRTVFGQFISVVPCRACRGEGRVIQEPCPSCHGEGRARAERPIRVEIPPGVTSENFITLRGEGMWGRGVVRAGMSWS